MSATQRCGVCWKTGEPGHECPSCDRPDCEFAARDRRRREFFDSLSAQPKPKGFPGTHGVPSCTAADKIAAAIDGMPDKVKLNDTHGVKEVGNG